MAPLLESGGPERWKAAAALHGKNFLDDPVIRFLLHHIPEKERQAYVPEFITAMVKSASLQDAIFTEAWIDPKPAADEDPDAPPACSTIWMRPGMRPDNWRHYIPAGYFQMAWRLGAGGLKRLIIEYQGGADKAKKLGCRWPDGQPITKFYYMFWVSTAVEARRQGLSSALIRQFMERAQSEGIPLWTESTTEQSHRLYVALGFMDVKMWRMGVGSVDEQGFPTKGGAGVPCWGLLWLPEEQNAEPNGETKNIGDSG